MSQQQLIHIRLRRELLKTLDEHAQQRYTSRTEYIRQAVVEKIRSLKPSATNATPQISLLIMTDAQLDDLHHAVIVERRRRQVARYQ